MKVFKFGGASVRNVSSFKNLVRILDKHQGEELFIVISAMGKMTNAFERLVVSYASKKDRVEEDYEFIKNYHTEIIEALFTNKDNAVFKDLDALFSSLRHKLSQQAASNYNYIYDSMVSYGELLSSTILSHYLNAHGYKNILVDARDIIRTDATYREARVNWDQTPSRVKKAYRQVLAKGYRIAITQGFIGASEHNYTTTLGREGSDFTAAIIGYSLKAREVVIWKDVDGVLNADPKQFEETIKIDHLTYSDAIELAYYGATVIHPKTIKPLENAGIPLRVKSFLNPESAGTCINKNNNVQNDTPCYIFKFNQILISIVPNDFSFIVEKNISSIFNALSKYNIKVNLMQNSALSFSICVDNGPLKAPQLINELNNEFRIFYNTSLTLVTVRNYNDEAIKKVCLNKEVLLEQKSRNTVQFVLR